MSLPLPFSEFQLNLAVYSELDCTSVKFTLTDDNSFAVRAVLFVQLNLCLPGVCLSDSEHILCHNHLHRMKLGGFFSEGLHLVWLFSYLTCNKRSMSAALATSEAPAQPARIEYCQLNTVGNRSLYGNYQAVPPLP